MGQGGKEKGLKIMNNLRKYSTTEQINRQPENIGGWTNMQGANAIQTFPKYVPVGNMELITPETAAAYLTHNSHNPRKATNKPQIEAYARDMKAGKWFTNGEAIVFDANGDLKDGQYRLMAIVKAETPVYMFVVRGVDPNITTFDYGLNRRICHELNCGRNAETLANFMVSAAARLPRNSKGLVRDYILTHKDEMQKAINLAQIGTTRPIGLKRDVYCAIYLMLRCGENPAEIEQFMRVVNTQFMLTDRESSPAIVLYKYLLANKARGGMHNEAIMESVETVLSAFADFTTGKKRTNAYKISDTTRARNMLTAVRKEDGLED